MQYLSDCCCRSSAKSCQRVTKDIEYTWQLRGHELIEAQHKLPLKSMSEDIECRTTIRTPGQPLSKESCCAVAVLVFIIEASKRVGPSRHRT